MAVPTLRQGFFFQTQFNKCGNCHPRNGASAHLTSRSFRASLEPLDDGKDKFYKELGMFSLSKRIEESIARAELLTPIALELEEAKHLCHEEVIQSCNLWDDLGKSNQILTELANSAKVVDTLRDVKYKAEEAKLITELAEMDSINYELFKQAYSASLDVSKFLDKYQMSKLLKEPYDIEGACMIIESRCRDVYSEKWAESLAQMYMKWAKRHGYTGRIVERCHSSNGGVKSATIEFEFKFAYGYLYGERGLHSMVKSCESSDSHPEVTSASVDVIPLFIESSPDLSIDDEDIEVSYPLYYNDRPYKTLPVVQIRHIPTDLIVQSSCERSCFANKVKALNRLKSKLLIIQSNLGPSSPKGDTTQGVHIQETRRYILGSTRMVLDIKSGVQIPDANSILNGNLDALIAAHLNSRHS